MGIDIRNILDHADQPDIDFLKQYIDEITLAGGTSKHIAARAGGEIYTALLLRNATIRLENAIHEMTRSNEELAKSNEKHAEASNRYARSLTFATWALFVATLLLVIIAAPQTLAVLGLLPKG